MLATLLVVPWRAPAVDDRARRVRRGARRRFGGVALWVAGADGVMQVLTFRGATGWQIESLAGSLIHLTGSATLRMESGAWRIGTINGAASIAMFAAAAPICVWSSWRGARLDRVGAGWLASVSTLLLLSALLSPQYVIWLAPAGRIAWAEGDRRLAVLTALAIVLTQILWTSYGGRAHGDFRPMLTGGAAQRRAARARRQRASRDSAASPDARAAETGDASARRAGDRSRRPCRVCTA